MGAALPRPTTLNARLETPAEEWPYLDEGTHLNALSRRRWAVTSQKGSFSRDRSRQVSRQAAASPGQLS
jgi:hypothetical protein